MLITSARGTAMAAEQVRASLLATELLENLRILSLTSLSSEVNRLPAIPCWRHETIPKPYDKEPWADLDLAIEKEGGGTPLIPSSVRTIEATRMYVQPGNANYHRYFRIEYPSLYPDNSRDQMIARIRVLVRYQVISTGRPLERWLELQTLVTLEDPLARLDAE